MCALSTADPSLELAVQDGEVPADRGSLGAHPSHQDPTNTNAAPAPPASTSNWFTWSKPAVDAKEEDQQSEGEEGKNEKVFVRTVRTIRNKFVGRKLEGIIYIRRVSGIAAAAMTCRISSTDTVSDGFEDDLTDLPSQCQRAITGTDMILDSLERRSRSWDGVDFNAEVSITRGLQIGVSDPFLGIIGWSFTMDITATVRSLLASRKWYEMMRASSVSRSSFRFPSFSMSMSGKGGGAAKDNTEALLAQAAMDSLDMAAAAANCKDDSDVSEEEDEREHDHT